MPRRSRTDLVIALLFVAAMQVDLWAFEGVSGVGAVTVACSLLFGASLVWRSTRTPLMVAVASGVLVVGAALGGELTETLTVVATAMFIVFSAGLHLPQRASTLAVLAFLAATWADLVIARDPEYALVSDIAFTSLIVVPGPWVAGRALRDRRKRTDELERLAHQLAEERETRAALAVLDERARIAREMHDVVAHSVSLMVVQTGAARQLLDDDPEQSRRALRTAEEVGREALLELRRTLGILRGGANEQAELAPQPGLAELDGLIQRTRAAGLAVTLEVVGQSRDLAPGPDLAAYRIVQEALTNTSRHAGPATAHVRVCWNGRWLEVGVTDDGRGPDPDAPSDGHGIVGMRERIVVYGGTLEAGLGPGGRGFRVAARIPLETARGDATP